MHYSCVMNFIDIKQTLIVEMEWFKFLRTHEQYIITIILTEK